MKHTPGPWSIQFRPSREHPPGEDLVIVKDGRVLAEIVFPTDSRVIRDALLMQAAPDMLEALERIASWKDIDQPPNHIEEARGIARAAIAKAKGENND